MDARLIRERDQIVERARRELRALVQESSWTQRRIEQANGFTQGYLSQVLKGQITLTARHLFGILFTIGVPPDDFLARILDRKSAANELRERMDRYEDVIERLEQQGLLGGAARGGSEEDPT